MNIILQKLIKIIPRILFYYSIVFSTFVVIGGFYTAGLTKEVISTALFVPVVVFLWFILIKQSERWRNKISNTINDISTKVRKDV